MNGYVDLYLLPVPRRQLAAYRRQARAFGSVAREYGALGYREFAVEDLHPEGVKSLAKAVALKRQEVLTAAIAEFRSRSHRDRVMKRVMNDPRVTRMMPDTIGNMAQMYLGGFRAIVKV